MNKKRLLLELNKDNPFRESKLHISDIVIQDLSYLKSLIDIVFEVEDKVSLKAAWVLEFVIKSDVKLMMPFLEVFIKNISSIKISGAIRSVTKISQLIIESHDKHTFLTLNQIECLIEINFDWLISKHKVAIKAYAMRNLFLLGKQEDWIHNELKIIVQANIYKESAAYKARGRITIEQINKWHKKSR